MKALGNNRSRTGGFVQISDGRRNALEGETDLALALVERDDIWGGAAGASIFHSV
jgi:hypothetical protein